MIFNLLVGIFLLLGANIRAENGESLPLPPLPSIETKIETEDDKDLINNRDTKEWPQFFNAIDFSGYFRLRGVYFRNPDLGLYLADKNTGISLMGPGLSMLKEDKTKSDDEDEKKKASSDTVNNFSSNMRFRLKPHLNVSEVVHIYGTFDFFDNLVLGSTPEKSSFMSMSQVSLDGVLKVKSLFAEVKSPIADLRFGRIPFNWGLGILYNSGDKLNDDYESLVDGIFLSTNFFEHCFSLGYSIAYVGHIGRGYGLSDTAKFSSIESGQRYPLESKETTHAFSMSILKKETDFNKREKLKANNAIFEYGLLASYRHQNLDSQYDGLAHDKSLRELSENIIVRRGHLGLASLWSAFSYQDFHIEAEAALMAASFNSNDNKRINFIKGGLALESKLGFLNDRLQVGINGGLASGDGSESLGMRNATYTFSFHPAYTIDLLLHREVLGKIAGTFYAKPHISYFFSENLGVRADVIASWAYNAKSAPGNSNALGIELDASAFFKTDSGFYFSLSYGALFPLAGLKHINLTRDEKTAKTAHTLQGFLGVSF